MRERRWDGGQQLALVVVVTTVLAALAALLATMPLEVDVDVALLVVVAAVLLLLPPLVLLQLQLLWEEDAEPRGTVAGHGHCEGPVERRGTSGRQTSGLGTWWCCWTSRRARPGRCV